jgi:hypothetical protein
MGSAADTYYFGLLLAESGNEMDDMIPTYKLFGTGKGR